MESTVGAVASPTRPETPARGPSRPREAEPSAFRSYFNDVSATRQLSAQDELAAALELRRIRRWSWEALLEEPTLRPAVLGAAARVLSPNAIAEPARHEISTLARELVDADRDLRALRAATRAVRERAEPGTRPRERCDRASAELKRVRDAFVAANLGLVLMVARRYANRGLCYLDAVQEGNAGLLKAVDRYDPQRGVRFSTYAVWWIRHSIGRALADRGTEIRLPAHLVERRQLLARRRAAFERDNGRMPTPGELAEAVGLSLRKVDRALGAGWERATTFDASTGRPGPLDVEGLPAHSVEPGRRLDDHKVGDALFELVNMLPQMQRDVLQRRFGFDGGAGMTLREIGEIHGLSRERIRQLQNRALLTLRRHLRERGIGHEIVLHD
jgi:RNA polymerase sigma factor (sigma-70 family)